MRIGIISPILPPADGEDYRSGYRLRDCRGIPAEFQFFYIEKGPRFILNSYDDVYAACSLVERVIACEKEGMDAVVINCSADTALRACREAVSIPVIGPTQSTMLYAPTLVDKYCVLTFSGRINSRFWRIAHELGVESKLACVESVEMDFEEISNGQQKVVDALCQKIIEIHGGMGCDGFILGCTDFEDVAPELLHKLEGSGCRVAVFKPFQIAAYQAYMTAAMGLRQGRNSYPLPQVYHG